MGLGVDAADYGSVIPLGPNYVAGCYNSSNFDPDVSLFTGATDVVFDDWFSLTSKVPKTFSQVRLVSASLTMSCISSSGDASGVYTAAFIPKRSFDYWRGANNVTLNNLQAWAQSATVPVNMKQPITVTYCPVDRSVLSYVPTTVGDPSAAVQGWFPGTFIIAVTNGTAQQQMQCEFFANYEALPLYANASNYGVSPSISDVDALTQGMNMAARSPRITMGDMGILPQPMVAGTGLADSAPMTGMPRQEKPMIETLVDSLPTIVDEGLEKAKALAPQLSEKMVKGTGELVSRALEALA